MKKGYLLAAVAVLLCDGQVPGVRAQGVAGSPVSSITGQYAFHLIGQEKTPSGGTELIGIAGSVATDGNGKITSGVLDKNSGTGYVESDAVTGTYQLDATGKGVFNIVTPAGAFSFSFYTSLPLATDGIKGTIVSGTGTIAQATGEIGLSLAYFQPLNGNEYDTFTASGETGAGSGSFTESGALHFVPANLPNGTVPGSVTVSSTRILNGQITSLPDVTGTYAGPSAGSPTDGKGRFTMVIPVNQGASQMAHFVVYQGLFPTSLDFFLSTDAHPLSTLTVSTSEKQQTYQSGSPF